MNSKELRMLSVRELWSRVSELKEELLQLRIQRVSAQCDKPHLRSYRGKELARCYTILRERQIRGLT